jgi:hypothetical protein
MVHLRKTIHKTKSFFNKRLKNFRSFFSGGYQKLPRSLSFNFLCNMDNAKAYSSDQFYNEFYDILQSDLSTMKMFGKGKEPAMEDTARSGNFMCFSKQSPQRSTYEGSVRSQLRKKEDLNSQNMNKGAHVLAQKMKKLDMMESGDLEHVLDIEEALHYYSRLKSPVYLDIVDRFFIDINSDLTLPQPSASFKRSKERLGPVQLHKR